MCANDHSLGFHPCKQIVGRGEQTLGLIRMQVLRLWDAAHHVPKLIRSSNPEEVLLLLWPIHDCPQ